MCSPRCCSSSSATCSRTCCSLSALSSSATSSGSSVRVRCGLASCCITHCAAPGGGGMRSPACGSTHSPVLAARSATLTLSFSNCDADPAPNPAAAPGAPAAVSGPATNVKGLMMVACSIFFIIVIRSANVFSMPTNRRWTLNSRHRFSSKRLAGVSPDPLVEWPTELMVPSGREPPPDARVPTFLRFLMALWASLDPGCKLFLLPSAT
mmetsp:Transcript_39532/g.88759  ORF Transcript_39532/g.88759 Transcript_39532/m.88759 type:complete len:209 (-) Transcript_39532:1229-1855(-)